MTQQEAIIEAFKALSGVKTIYEINAWVRQKYGELWKVLLWRIWFPYLVAEIALQMYEKSYVFLKEFPLVNIAC